VIIFVVCLALVLFAIENTEPALIRVTDAVKVQAPLSVELILAMGIGAVLAWVFSVWAQLQRLVENNKEIRNRETRIQELEEDVERYRAEIEEQQRLLPAASTKAQETDAELVNQS
jgi:uncharacterized integral membrane protein